MDPNAVGKLRNLTTFEDLVDYLRDDLDWPIEAEDAREITFTYTPEELGIAPQHAAKIESIKQVRPLTPDQSWGIFYVAFESKRLPIVVLRRILRALVPQRRKRSADQPVWALADLLFISAFGDAAAGEREIAFAHFHQENEGLPTLRVLGWDGSDTALKLDYVDAVLKARLCWPDDPSDAEAWREQWTPAFRHPVRHVIRTADALAERLAKLARGIRDAAITLMAHETEEGPLRRLHKAFQTALLHDLTEADFADTYAQTITYGLLTAAISRTDMDAGRYGTALGVGDLTEMVPITNPFLAEMLRTFLKAGGRGGGINFDELGIQDVVELLRGDETDLPAVLRDFGNRTQGEDPVIHFYEHFLAAYDKQLKVQRGIFYTPQPIVSYIVRSVHELLQSEFGLADGLASTVTWGEMAARHPELKTPEGTEPSDPFVVILDPATGTATFLVEIIEVIHRTLVDRWQRAGLTRAEQRAAWNAYVPVHLLPRLYGYELMMAPYAIAHMKIGLKLSETGYRFGSEKRVRVYLTNTLEPAAADDAQIAFDFAVPALAHEAQAVNEVKRRVAATIVVGNPPYAGHSSNDSPWIADLLRGLDVQGQAVESYFEVDGHSLNERNPKWLNDDYVKFIRFGQWRIAQTGAGILAYITNHGYMDNPTFRGMRQSLMTGFSNMYTLDLHGSTKKRETTPEGNLDENVFDILPGVAILLAAKNWSEQSSKAPVKHADLWGVRGVKYAWLRSKSFSTTCWENLSPIASQYLFVPLDTALHDEYYQGIAITEILPVNSLGLASGRDRLTVAWTPSEIWTTVQTFSSLPIEVARTKYDLGPDSRDWKVRFAQSDLLRLGPSKNDITRILYRPFDVRWTYYSDKSRGFLCMPRHTVMQHIVGKRNLSLVFARSLEVDREYDQVLCSRDIVQLHTLSMKAVNYVAPLYLYATSEPNTLFDSITPPDGSSPRQANLSSVVAEIVYDNLELELQDSGCGDLHSTVGPDDIFHYLYALMYSTSYRKRYSGLLKKDFPRVQFTNNLGLFAALIGYGADLVALHTLDDTYDVASWTQASRPSPLTSLVTAFVERDSGKRVGKIRKGSCYKDSIVYLDTTSPARSSYFQGIPREVWDFQVGGYQVLFRWLYDRRKTRSREGLQLTEEDIAHYQRIVVALKETIRLMGEIDAVIEAHGGWPIQ